MRRAADLFHRVEGLIGKNRVKKYKGSFSIFGTSTDAMAATIVIFEAGKGQVSGVELMLVDGAYVLIRVPGKLPGLTIVIAPKRRERFAYFRLSPQHDLDEIAAVIVACVSGA